MKNQSLLEWKQAWHTLVISLMAMLIPFGAWSQNPNKPEREGKYAYALKLHAQKLAKKPNKKRLQKNFGKAYQKLWPRIQAKQERLFEATSTFVGDETVEQFKDYLKTCRHIQDVRIILQKLNLSTVAISRKEDVAIAIPDQADRITTAHAGIQKANRQAADMHYRQGLAHLQHDDLAHQKTAALEFKRCMEFVPDYLDAAVKYKKAQKGATKRIIILPYSNRSGQDDFGALGDQLSTSLASKLNADPAVKEFLEVITEGELRAALDRGGYEYGTELSDATAEELRRQLQAHVVYFGKINQVLRAEPRVSESEEEYKAKVVVRTEKAPDGKEKKIKEERTAYYKSFEEMHLLTLTGAHIKLSKSGTSIDQFSKQDRFTTYWTTYKSGNRKVYQKIERSRTTPPPDGQRVNVLIAQLAEEMYANIKRDVLWVSIPVIHRIDQLDTEVASQGGN